MPTAAQISAARELCEKEVLMLPGVTMVSEGQFRGKPCIVVGIERESAALRKRIKRSYAEIPVCVEVSGKISAL